MVVIDMSSFVKKEHGDTPEAYQARCIVFDAERAAKMGEPSWKACPWKMGTPQYDLWVLTYTEALNG